MATLLVIAIFFRSTQRRNMLALKSVTFQTKYAITFWTHSTISHELPNTMKKEEEEEVKELNTWITNEPEW